MSTYASIHICLKSIHMHTNTHTSAHTHIYDICRNIAYIYTVSELIMQLVASSLYCK